MQLREVVAVVAILTTAAAAGFKATATPARSKPQRPHLEGALKNVSADFKTPDEAARKLQNLANQLRSANNNLSLFPSVYTITIANTMAGLRNAEFYRPQWAYQLVLNYANLYRRTIYNELSGHRERVPQGWQLDFGYCEQRTNYIPDLDLVYGINVHIARDLVEALYLTPTNFSDDLQRADFFQITEVLRQAMPQIWQVFLSYSQARNLPPSLEQDAMMNWISRLRAGVWENAKKSYHLTAKGRQNYLMQLDAWLSEQARKHGLLLPLL